MNFTAKAVLFFVVFCLAFWGFLTLLMSLAEPMVYGP